MAFSLVPTSFRLFPRPAVSTSSVTPSRRLSSRPRRTQPRASKLEPHDLRDLYTICEPAALSSAESAARSSTASLSKYLHNAPIPAHTHAAFSDFLRWRSRPNAPLHWCLDAGCGRGWSTLHLARRFPHLDVLGVDKSLVRLQRNAAFRDAQLPDTPSNALILRADLIPFWRLCWHHSDLPVAQYILYPNPYPKKSDLKRRWHGLPIFPIVVAIGGYLEVRASWPAYLQEFRAAYIASLDTLPSDMRSNHTPQSSIGEVEQLHFHTDPSQPPTFHDDALLSSFETKYLHVGQPVYRLQIIPPQLHNV